MTAAFKEWKSICDALGHGDQTIILRKGGIAEGNDGFLWQHREFFLFPTAHHDHENQLKSDTVTNDSSFSKQAGDQIEISLRAQIIWSADLDSLDAAAKLDSFHIWKPEVIDQRFDYSDSKGIRLALLRVYRLKTPWVLDDRPDFGGCRSWLELPEPDTEHMDLESVMSDEDFSRQKNQLEQLLSVEGVEITTIDQ